MYMENQETQCAQVAMIHENGDISVQWEGGINDAEVERISNDLRKEFVVKAMVGDWVMIKSTRDNSGLSGAMKTIISVEKTIEPTYSGKERQEFWSRVQ
jgi:hypothetical protein